MTKLIRPLKVGDRLYLKRNYWSYTADGKGGALQVTSVNLDNEYGEPMYGFFSMDKRDIEKDNKQLFTIEEAIDTMLTNRILKLQRVGTPLSIPVLPKL